MARRLGVVLLLLIYLGAVAVSVFGPNPDSLLDDGAQRGRQIEAAARAAAQGERSGDGLRAAPTRELIPGLNAEEAGNILMFVPLGLLFPVAWPRLRWLTVPLGIALSGSIELAQGLFLSWRSPTVADIVWNSTGAAIGFALWLAAFAVYRLVTAVGTAPAGARSR